MSIAMLRKEIKNPILDLTPAEMYEHVVSYVQQAEQDISEFAPLPGLETAYRIPVMISKKLLQRIPKHKLSGYASDMFLGQASYGEDIAAGWKIAAFFLKRKPVLICTGIIDFGPATTSEVVVFVDASEVFEGQQAAV